ncbi:DUF1465 family protein [Sphingomonas profundi]|uniref:DUF1465 family protein n=1 Tax=Alterirhizorhabdus profundi TaxID=2681549 RepID=UPI0012E72B84|nr:DUF1465 family protein [Sphingomonas profundi]
MRSNGLTMRLVDALYTEAMILADEARGYFDERGRFEREALAPIARVAFTCESLKVTTRLMHIIAWLLTRRALEAGEISAEEAREPARRLGRIDAADPASAAALPETALALVAASDDLYQRVRRLDEGLEQPAEACPAHGLLRRLERAF